MIVTLLAAVASTLVAQAQPAGAASPPTAASAPASEAVDEGTVSELVVTARRREAVKSFVEAVMAPPPRRRAAVWEDEVCPGLVGFKRAQGEAIADRIAAVAFSVGLDVGEPGCKPNVLIIGTPESDTLVRDIVRRHWRVFDKHSRFGLTRGKRGLKKFVESEKPVRWWHVGLTYTLDGQLAYGRAMGPEGDQAPVVEVRVASRTASSTKETMGRVLIVVDGSRVGDVPFRSMADYLALVAMAQVDPEADLSGAPSVLNLFDDAAAGRTPAPGLTEWDVAFLQAVYGVKRNAATTGLQRVAIVDAMARKLGVKK